MPASAPIIHLLIVDDDPLICELLTQLLRGDGLVVDSVASGDAALQALRNSPYAAVLTDLQMPGTSGLELAQQIRSSPGTPLLIGMSARSLADDERHALDEFLQKPFSAHDFRAALARATVARQTPDPQIGDALLNVEPKNEMSPKIGECSPIGHPATFTKSVPFDPPLGGVLDLEIFSRLQATIGSPQLLQLYEMTASDVEARLVRMHTCLHAGDSRTLREEAHAIKGGCAMVGAVEVSRLAASAESRSETDTDHLKEMAKACIRLRQVVTIVSP